MIFIRGFDPFYLNLPLKVVYLVHVNGRHVSIADITVKINRTNVTNMIILKLELTYMNTII